eukprot:TRINITY_DN1214_c0_g1_i1.p1 TRINITY_DN1214_c0_g1~~TRINITY_DN1214_c0_g1_i1.p1  ORF type:complete len:520 (-),score=61.48 TRINITY_DN1214_c0_g1_i1:91-1650(-)
MTTSFKILLTIVTLWSVSSSLPIPNNEVPLRWAELNLELIAKTRFLTPPGMARSISTLATAMYDAITPYTPPLWPSIDLSIPRRPLSEQNDENRAIAASYAAYRVITHLFSGYPQFLGPVNDFMTELGLSAENETWAICPEGFGNRFSENLITRRLSDGMNELGSSQGTDGVPYSDDTYYFPVNDPQPNVAKTNCSTLRSINHWQPLRVPTRTGGSVVQKQFLCAQCIKTSGFAITNPFQFLPPGPPRYGTSTQYQFITQFSEIVDMTSRLTDQQKIMAEFWGDGPGTSGPPGHWHKFTIDLCRTRQLSLVSRVKLLFLQGNAVFDGGIAAWAIKRLYDSVRPITAIQCLNAGKLIQGWLGLYRGTGTIDGNDWQPYQDPYFLTPSFSEYVSGHSVFSMASAEVLRRFFCSDTFGGSYTVLPGNSTTEPKITSNQTGYIAGLTDVPNTGPGTPGYVPAATVTLRWPTFSSAALEAAVSRMYGGIHIRSSNQDGVELGRNVAGLVWNRYVNLIGTHVCSS